MATYLDRLIEYNGWANLELIDFLGTLPDEMLDARVPGVYGSIRETLAHLLTSERNYRHRLARLPLDETPLPAPPQLDDLKELAEKSASHLATLAGSLPPPDEFMQLADGKRAAATILTQLIAHGCEHRAHVDTILGANGIEPREVASWAHGIYVHGDDWPDDLGPEPKDRCRG